MSETIIESSLAESQTLLRLEPGQTLFREGENPRGVHVLQSGEVDLLFSARNGNTKALRIMQPGQILGLSPIVSRRPYDCTATARTGCEVAFIGREEFLRTLEETPAVWFSVLRLLSTDINAAYDDMRLLATR